MNLEQLKAKLSNHELRNQHPYYMADAIYDIPGCLEACLDEALLASMQAALQAVKPAHIFAVGCGTSYNAAQAVAYACRTLLKIPAEVYDAYDFQLDLPPGVDAQALVISISQSGQSLTTCLAQEQAKARGAMTVAISGKPNSRLATSAGLAVIDPYRLEIPLGKTRSYLSSAFQGMLAAAMTAAPAVRDEFLLNAHEMIHTFPAYMAEWEKSARSIALDWAGVTSRYILTGFGIQKPNADELGLKIIEVIGESATSFGLEGFTHGPKVNPAILEKRAAARAFPCRCCRSASDVLPGHR